MANSLLLKQALDLFSPVHGQFPPFDAEALEQPLLPLAPAAIKATKPLKKGKREPEDDLDTKVNLTSTAEERLGPILKLFDAVGEGKPSPLLHCFYDGTWSTVKRSFTVVHDFKDVCFHSYFSLMDEIRKCPDQNYHEIRYMNKLILSFPFPHRNQELLDPEQSKLRDGLDSAIVREKPNNKWTDVAAVLHRSSSPERDGLGELYWLRLLLLKLTLHFFRESDSRVSDLDNGCGAFPHGVNGTTERPRMCVFRSNKHLYVQVIDDTKMHTLASASTKKKPLKSLNTLLDLPL
ncbi:unnamed protein product [Brassica oleracea var. botrytis]|uniref:(rape) hypothetical protein n=1 Tax=Brassica napus TaxID=3708 RepID=A0A816L2U6_BRANA|nr:unnamed protein product [Brassica napus]